MFAQVAVDPNNFWQVTADNMWLKIGIAFIFGIAMMVGFLYMPTRGRRIAVGLFTFLAGLYWVLFWLVPTPVNRAADDLPLNAVEEVAFWLEDANPIVSNFANILTAFLLGLGIYSLVRIHSVRLFKQQKDWPFSLALLLSIVIMAVVGYADWLQKLGNPALADPDNWGNVQYTADLLFDGLLQEMDAAMFSIIAFYILSAAYRAFRIRSVEATILLATAFIVMLSFLGVVSQAWGNAIDGITGDNVNSFLNNFKLSEIYAWIRSNVQSPSIRAIEFGIGIGALAMGLRLWLSLERGGVRS